ncbi:hypothetical protein ABTF55_21255, partial [Acinetobacter baumannii]
MVATGFERKDPFAKPVATPIVEAVPEKIVMTLDVEAEAPKAVTPVMQVVLPTEETTVIESLAPTLQDLEITPVVDMHPV